MSDLAIELINQAYENKATFLDLGNCGLASIPKEIVKLKDCLQALNLGQWYHINNEEKECANNWGQNSFAHNTDSLGILSDLQNLTALHISGCNITGRSAEYISRLQTLISLDIDNNIIGENRPEYIARLSACYLRLLHCLLTEIILAIRAQHISANFLYLTASIFLNAK